MTESLGLTQRFGLTQRLNVMEKLENDGTFDRVLRDLNGEIKFRGWMTLFDGKFFGNRNQH